jgi:predicted nucleic acid-binding protein
MSEYLDTSVIVKWFREGEEYREQSLELRTRIIDYESESFHSFYGPMELVRALVKNKYPKNKIEDSFQSIMDLYKIDALKGVGIEEVLYRAKDIAIRLNLYAGDALHLASAVHHGCNIFWSEDRHHLKSSTRNYMDRYNIKIKSLSQIRI